MRSCGACDKNGPETRNESHLHAEKHGVVAEFEERVGIAMSRTSVQGVEMGAGSGTVCWHRMGESGTGPGCVAGQDGCDDQVEKTENG